MWTPIKRSIHTSTDYHSTWAMYALLALLLNPVLSMAEEQAPSALPALGDETEENDDVDPLDRRIASERLGEGNPFSLIQHRPNYFLPIAHNFNAKQSNAGGGSGDVEPTEIKFQLSFKIPIAYGLLRDKDSLNFAYTQQSWWQLYDLESSSPFRETNHEPELYYSVLSNHDIGIAKSRLLRLGINHQSNGQSGNLSRSWNRIFFEWVLQSDNNFFSIKPWWRIPDAEERYPGDPLGDDNPDIEEYMGNFELYAFRKSSQHSFGMMLRNNLDANDNHGAVQLDYTYPLDHKTRGYVQLFGGFGESLIDYKKETYRISLGIMLYDWL